jgi:hypothetical protein
MATVQRVLRLHPDLGAGGSSQPTSGTGRWGRMMFVVE